MTILEKILNELIYAKINSPTKKEKWQLYEETMAKAITAVHNLVPEKEIIKNPCDKCWASEANCVVDCESYDKYQESNYKNIAIDQTHANFDREIQFKKNCKEY